MDAQWQWIAAAIGFASLVCLLLPSERRPPHGNSCELQLIGLLLLWMALQLVPLPPFIVKVLSFQRWLDEDTARSFVGSDRGSWIQLSVAPAATFGRLLDVLPAVAAFVAAREIGCWWNGRRLWTTIAPVIGVASLESLIGVLQFSPGVRVTGTYVNRNHFAGLLEMAFPLAVMAAVSGFRRTGRYRQLSMATALKTSILLGIAAFILFAITASLSRMGFLATIAASGAITGAWLLVNARAEGGASRRRIWLITIALPACLLLFFATGPLLQRFVSLPSGGEIGANGRIQLWKETASLINAYKWTGCGLGAYEHGLYRLQTSMPGMTVDFAHNDYLQILAELGLFGGVLMAWLGVWIVRRVFSVVIKRHSRNWPLAIGVFGSLVAIGLHSLVDFNLYIPANALVFAWIAGVAASPAFTEG